MRMANEVKLTNANRRRATVAEPVVPLADSVTELSSGAARLQTQIPKNSPNVYRKIQK
jgi:hypothetical protein